MPEGLSKADQIAVREIVRNARKNDGVPQTAQQSIPFDRMFPDGICRVGLDYYTKTVQFQDINYQLAQQEDKTEIFEEWCAFLNFFDSSVKFQLSFENMATDVSDFEKSIKISHKNDGFDDVRDEYSEVLLHQMEAGNNGLTKTKYLTFGINAESMKTAKPRLIHIETDILNNFKRLGVQAKSLNGSERLELMHRQFHIGDDAKFHFDWKYLTGSGLSVKDFIAPSSFAFPTGRYFQIGDMYGCMSFLSIDASDISDRLLADFLSMESSQIVTMHIQSVDQNEAIKTIKHTITELDRSKIEEQKKAVRAGYDMDIIPSDLATYGKDAKALLKELQSQNERMFLLTFLVMNTGKTKQELENNVFQATSIAQKHNCNLVRLDYQQEQGLMSTLPLANNLIEIQRGMTTSSTAIFVPFTTQELFQSGDEALYYGLNALSNNMIMVDRKKLKNPNALILGTPGSGKSFSAKREIANSFLVTDDDIIISDPESEYSPLVARFGGQVIKISPTSDQFINPMDINMNYSDDDNPIALKADFILSLCELIVGNKDGLRPVEKTVIDRCIRQIYQKYFENPGPENMPILGDLYQALLAQEEPEAKHVATALEIYVSGSLNVFNHRTNVELTNRLVCYDIKDLGKQLKKIGMLVVQDQVWGRVTENRSQGRSTRYYMDEMHLLLREDQTAAYTVEIWKRFRKWGGIPTGITQNVKDTVHTHTYTSAMTKTPTTTEEGIMTYTCTTCGHTYTQPITKIVSDAGTADSGSAGQSSKPSGRNNTGNNKNNSSKNTDSQNNPDIETKPYIKDDSGKEGWDVIKPQLEEAKAGDTVTVAMNGTTVVPKDVIDSIKGKDTTLVLDMGNGLSWKINGQDITGAAGDIDFGVTVGADAGKSIPVDVINNVTGERYSMNLTLAYDGEFGFTATLTVNMESKNAGLYANLFYYNEQTGELEFISAGQIDADGNVELVFTHASDYTIVVDAKIMSDNGQADNKSDETIPASKTDDSTSKYAWNNTIIIIIGICIILIVFGAVFYVRKKSGSEEE